MSIVTADHQANEAALDQFVKETGKIDDLRSLQADVTPYSPKKSPRTVNDDFVSYRPSSFPSPALDSGAS